jgi:hypothetical protein
MAFTKPPSRSADISVFNGDGESLEIEMGKEDSFESMLRAFLIEYHARETWASVRKDIAIQGKRIFDLWDDLKRDAT